MAVKSVFVNYVNDSLIHERTTKDGKRQFVNVSIPTSRSENGYGSIAVAPRQLLAAKNKAGVAKDGYHSIVLGNPEKTRKMSVKQNGEYVSIDVTNADVAADFDGAREAYRNRAAVPAEA